MDGDDSKSANGDTKVTQSQRAGFSLRRYMNDKREQWIDHITLSIASRPGFVLICAMCIFVVAMVAIGAVGTRQTRPSEYEWELPFDKFSERRDMIRDAEDDVDSGLLLERSDNTYDWYFLFDAKPKLGKNVCDRPYGLLTARNVQAMCQAEQELWGRGKYAEQFCPLTNGTCLVPDDSLARILYSVPENTPLAEASPAFLQCELLEQSSIETVWNDEIVPNKGSYEFYFDGEAFDRGWPCRGRSLIYIATPLRGYSQISTWNDAQFRKVQKRIVNRVESDLISKYNMKAKPLRSVYLEEARAGASGEKFEVMWWNPFLEDAQFVEAVDSDFMFAIASILFVWFWMCVHTNSFFIGTVSILQIILSLPLALFWYRVVLWRRYISIMQNLAVFVILGIGADDVFVYNDAWLQSANLIEPQGPDELDLTYEHRRTKYAYSRAFQSILNTSFTTAVAFFATAIAELIPIASFGIFAALAVMMNFALVLTVTPCVVLIHHRRMTRRARKSGQRVVDDFADDKHANEAGTTQPIFEHESTPKRAGVCARMSKHVADAWVRTYMSFLMAGSENKTHIIDAAMHPEAKTAPEGSAKAVAKLTAKTSLVRKPVAVTLCLGLGAYGLTMASLASRLTPPSEQEVWFQRRHMATKVDKLFDDGYGSNDATFYPTLSIVWGMDRIKRGKSFDPYVPHKSRGEVRYSDRPIDLHTEAAQSQIFSACDNLETFNCESGCTGETLVRPNSTLCFLREFEQWHGDEYGQSIQGLTKTTFNDRLRVFRQTTSPSSDDYSSWENYIGFVDDELRFVRIDTRVSMTLEEPTQNKKMVIRRTNKFLSRYCRQVRDSGLPDVWQFSYAWVWFKTQRALVKGLLIGMAIAFPVAFITLVGATQNFVLAFYAIVTIGMIVSSVLGLAWLLGWALGIKESVAGVIVIGLAVDYCIHLGHMYDAGRHEQDLYNREDKAVFAIISMGPTVFAGAVTTAGAAIFLLACQLTFFTQMGILILSTIVSSLVFSLFFYVPLLYTIGPDGDFGSVSAIKHAIQDRCCKKF